MTVDAAEEDLYARKFSFESVTQIGTRQMYSIEGNIQQVRTCDLMISNIDKNILKNAQYVTSQMEHFNENYRRTTIILGNPENAEVTIRITLWREQCDLLKNMGTFLSIVNFIVVLFFPKSHIAFDRTRSCNHDI